MFDLSQLKKAKFPKIKTSCTVCSALAGAFLLWPASGLAGEDAFARFLSAYTANGGDGAAVVRIGPARGLTAPSDIRCRLKLDLTAGAGTASCRKLDQPVDLWLVDNQDGEDNSFLPEEGDRLQFLGSLDPNSAGTPALAIDLGGSFFESFELDLAVATEPGVSPVDGFVALGSRTAFERRFTRERLARDGFGTAPQSAAFRSGNRNRTDPRVRAGLVSEEVLAGADTFFRETFDGNGRNCGTCHPVGNNTVIEAAFVSRLLARRPNDPLFVANPDFAGAFPVPLLEVPELLEGAGLIRENIDGFEAPAEKFVMRSVPHTLSMATSISSAAPDDGSSTLFQERTGWSGDGAPVPGTLRMFVVGAIIQHYRRFFDDINPTVNGLVNFRLPTDEELDNVEAYMLATGRTNELDLDTMSLEDETAEAGREMFLTGGCNNCHDNGGANTAFDGLNRVIDTGVERLIAARDIVDYPCDGGHIGQGLETEDFDSDCGTETAGPGDGINDAFGTGGFNISPLVEAADTAPFFHNNGRETLEGAVAFYGSEMFLQSPGGLALTNAGVTVPFGDDTQAPEVVAISAFLRTINAGFNLSLCEQRLDGAETLLREGAGDRKTRRIARRLIKLAAVECKDALQVLRQSNIYPDVRDDVRRAVRLSRIALYRYRVARNPARQAKFAARASAIVAAARDELGSGMTFEMGEGNLTF